MGNNQAISGSFKQNREVIDSGRIIITNNTLYYRGSVLQLANISRAWIGSFDPLPTPKWTYVMMAIGSLLFLSSLSSEIFTFILIGAAIFGIGAYGQFNHSKNNNPKYGIQIEMNSSFIVVFSSPDRPFLEKILQSIGDDFSGRFEGKVEFNIEDRSVHVENNSGVVNTAENVRVTNTATNNRTGEEHEHNSNQ